MCSMRHYSFIIHPSPHKGPANAFIVTLCKGKGDNPGESSKIVTSVTVVLNKESCATHLKRIFLLQLQEITCDVYA